MKDPIKIKATVPTAKLDAGVSKASVQVGIDQRVVVPRLPDYFEWRQEAFQPLYHWPLTDGEGATVATALSGPDGTYGSGLEVGQPLVRPNARYSTVKDSRSDYPVTPNFIHQTFVFTISCWFRVNDVNRFLMDYKMSGSLTPGSQILFDSINRMRFRFADGEVLLPTATGIRYAEPLDVGRKYYMVWVGDGDQISLYLDGEFRMGTNAPDPILDPSPLDLTVGAASNGAARWIGDMQGVLIDDRPWSPWEIRADYERGLSAIEIDIPVDPHIPDSILALDATEFEKTASNTPVSDWNDGAAIQSDENHQPYVRRSEGYIGVQFDGSQWLDLPDLQMEPEEAFSIYIAMMKTSDFTTEGLFSTEKSTNGVQILLVNSGRIRSRVGLSQSSNSETGVLPADTKAVINMRSEGLGGDFQNLINGTVVTTETVGTVTEDPDVIPILGARNNADGEPGDLAARILIHEVRIYNRELSEDEDRALREYFTLKWGI